MNKKSLKLFVITSFILLFISLFILDVVFFVAISISSLYVLVSNLIVMCFSGKLSDSAIGVIIALICVSSAFVLYLLLPILHLLKF